MTHPSDIAGLINGWSCDERRREKECRDPNGCHCREITALSARVKELEAELFDTQAALGGVNRDWNKAMDRALRAEQLADHVAAAIRRLASGPEGGSVKMEGAK